MITCMQQLCLGRLRDLKTEYGHAMPCGVSNLTPLNSGIGGFYFGGICLAPIAFVDQGSSVPISRGGPPLLFE